MIVFMIYINNNQLYSMLLLQDMQEVLVSRDWFRFLDLARLLFAYNIYDTSRRVDCRASVTSNVGSNRYTLTVILEISGNEDALRILKGDEITLDTQRMALEGQMVDWIDVLEVNEGDVANLRDRKTELEEDIEDALNIHHLALEIRVSL
jgi:hypothetical protein